LPEGEKYSLLKVKCEMVNMRSHFEYLWSFSHYFIHF